jgi:conjugal transfer mating pair stabilization protein TraN
MCFAQDVSPDLQKEFDQYSKTAKSLVKNIQSTQDFQSFNASNYTNNPEALKNPTQEQYYNNPNAMANDSNSQFNNSDQAQSTTQLYLSKPEINPNTQNNQKLKAIIANAGAISNGNSSDSLACVTKPTQSHTDPVEKTCTSAVSQQITCTDNPVISFVGQKMQINWANSCSNNIIDSCTLVSQRCTEPQEQRQIEDHKVNLTCWQYRYIYQCGSQSKNTCSSMQNCSVVSSKCIENNGKFCTKRKYIYSCPTKKCDSNQIICGSPGFCTNGKCYVPDRTAHQGTITDFAKPISKLGAIAQAGKDVSSQDPNKAKNNIRVETGTVMSCNRTGTYNHCTHPVSTQEKQLYQAKKDHKVIVVGNYCSSKVLGACLAWTEKSCVFESQFAMLVQKYGKPQIGMNFGTSKNPDCRGFTVAEFQHLDFNQIDFSSLYSNLVNSTKIPSKQEIINKVTGDVRS